MSTETRATDRRTNGANLGFEATLWAAADKLRGQMDAAEYKHFVLGLVFLKYVSDSFEEIRRALKSTPQADPDDPREYRASKTLWVPPLARWPHIASAAGTDRLGSHIDAAMSAFEEENPTLRGVLPAGYDHPSLDQRRMEELVHAIGTIGLGDEQSKSKDILGRVYEYFLGRFAAREAKSGGEFYTPQCVVKLLVEMLRPFRGKVYDPCCGSGGMFVQSKKFVLAHGGSAGDLALYGQESNPKTWRLAKMNLVIRGIGAELGPKPADSFHSDLHGDLQADFILANPPFNMSDWGAHRLVSDQRWRYGLPSTANANFAWVQHMLHHLGPDGTAGFVLSNGSLSSDQHGDAAIRRALIEADLVDAIVYLPPQLFYTTQISASLWFLRRKKAGSGQTDRRGQILFIYAYDFGQLVDRTHRELSDDEIARVAATYSAWTGCTQAQPYCDVPGFCKSASLACIREHRFALVPGRYVGFARSATNTPDVNSLSEELHEIKSRLAASEQASWRALALLEELLDGSTFAG